MVEVVAIIVAPQKVMAAMLATMATLVKQTAIMVEDKEAHKAQEDGESTLDPFSMVAMLLPQDVVEVEGTMGAAVGNTLVVEEAPVWFLPAVPHMMATILGLEAARWNLSRLCPRPNQAPNPLNILHGPVLSQRHGQVLPVPNPVDNLPDNPVISQLLVLVLPVRNPADVQPHSPVFSQLLVPVLPVRNPADVQPHSPVLSRRHAQPCNLQDALHNPAVSQHLSLVLPVRNQVDALLDCPVVSQRLSLVLPLLNPVDNLPDNPIDSLQRNHRESLQLNPLINPPHYHPDSLQHSLLVRHRCSPLFSQRHGPLLQLLNPVVNQQYSLVVSLQLNL